ncbi:MAG: nickel-dependent hydrogenase large subunit [Candidatus Dormibacteria bacterium]
MRASYTGVRFVSIIQIELAARYMQIASIADHHPARQTASVGEASTVGARPAGTTKRASRTATDLVIAPVTRVGGAVGLRVQAGGGAYRDARVSARVYRGYEGILVGRDIRDAIFTSSRCCGLHGGQHAIASAQAVEMAVGLAPPPTAVAIRNLLLSAETIHAEAAQLVLMAGPDFCEQSVRANWPALWSAAERAEAPNALTHGMGTIGEIMYALNPWEGKWYRQALTIARIPYAMYAILGGKYPHPETIVPGGVSTLVSTTNVHDYLIRLLSLVDPAKQIATMLVDLLDFSVATVPELALVGAGPANMVDSGQWDDPEGYDPTWEGLTARGNRRWAAPGAIIDGKLVTSDLREIAEGIEEGSDHSYYLPWQGFKGPLEKQTEAMPGAEDTEGTYSWSNSVRWRGHVVETGPAARLWATALRGTMPENPFITASDGGVQIDLPRSALPRLVLEWKPPPVWNAIERDRARLYGIVFAALVAANNVLKVLDLQKQGRDQTSNHFHPGLKGSHTGVGFAGDGLLGHWIQAEGMRIENYQVVSPSTINLGPGGPAEAAINDTPILGDGSGAEALVALRSFDPCAHCAAH